MADVLRIIDVGTVSALRSQSLWHGIPAAMVPGEDPVLSFCRPDTPYVGIGFHRSTSEIDRYALERRRWPLIRRRIGGGPVYLDENQLFFQISSPVVSAFERLDKLYGKSLDPAVAALRSLGIDASRRGVNDLSVGGKKISGTGAGCIGGGRVVVGNILFDFPHRRMAEILAVPSPEFRRSVRDLMGRYVTSLRELGVSRLSEKVLKSTLVEHYAAALALSPQASDLSDREREAIVEWEEKMRAPAWLEDRSAPARNFRQVKICADAWVTSSREDGVYFESSIVEQSVERFRAQSECGSAQRLIEKIEGAPADEASLSGRLESFGSLGESAMRHFRRALVLR